MSSVQDANSISLSLTIPGIPVHFILDVYASTPVVAVVGIDTMTAVMNVMNVVKDVVLDDIYINIDTS